MPMIANSTATRELDKTLAMAIEHIDRGQLNSAADIYQRLLVERPDDAGLHHTLGLVYLEQSRYDAAIDQIKRSIAIRPDHSKYHRSLGDACQAAGHPHAALSAYQHACVLNPANIDALINLGNIFHELDRHPQALATFQKVIDLAPNHLMALNNIGKTLHDKGALDQALKLYNRCLDIDPHYAEARFNRAVVLLTLGDYQHGWPEYEWRFRRRNACKVYPHQLTTPRWQGEAYQGRRLLVHCEQGIGDVLQFVRYLPMVKQLGGTLILEVHPALLALLKSMNCIDEWVAFDARRPPMVGHDVHIPLLSLPNLFHTTMDSLPKQVPYVHSDAGHTTLWRKQLAVDGLKIGLVWTASDINPKRNCPLVPSCSWFQVPGLHFISLQKGPTANQLQPTAGSAPITALGHRLNDFRDTAAVVANLDLVISVDTAVAHLAGAMGKPVWVLLPCSADWRWPPHGQGTPWYPTAKLFRQSPSGNWQPVIDQVKHALTQLQRNPTSQRILQPPDATKGGLAVQSHHMGRKIKKVLLVSPIYGGSLEIIRYLHSGFAQAGISAVLQDNNKFYPVYRQIEQGPYDQQSKEHLLGRMLGAIDQGLVASVEQYKPDLVLAIAQSPIDDATVADLRAKGIPSAYWFVEDHRLRPYWAQKAPLFDFFFTIQHGDDLKRQFDTMGHPNWHYLPLACDPTVHKPWQANPQALQPYRCQIGFMGAPYLNRIAVFEELVHWDLGIWGQGWEDAALSPKLKACIKQGKQRISVQESVKIYCAADIVVNLHSSPYAKGVDSGGDFVNPRTFEVAGCAGFQLSDHRTEMPALFSPGKEIILFDSITALKKLIEYWLPRPELRKEVSQKAQKNAYANHTYQQRAEEIIRLVEK
jgi:spore maturation protein CgeB/Flp pilus assembly protein TadD